MAAITLPAAINGERVSTAASRDLARHGSWRYDDDILEMITLLFLHDLTGFNRIAIHFPCVGSWMAPGQGSPGLV